MLQLASCLVETVTSIFDEKRLTGSVFPDVVEYFDTIHFRALLYEIFILNFKSYLVKIMSSYLDI
jgi:hypothetical protein